MGLKYTIGGRTTRRWYIVQPGYSMAECPQDPSRVAVSEWSIDIVTITGPHLLLSGQGRMDYFAQHPHSATSRLDRSWRARCCAFALVSCAPAFEPAHYHSAILPRFLASHQRLKVFRRFPRLYCKVS
jgi:hypothetical protein